MLKQSSHARVTATDIAAIERRMQALEKRLERLSGSAGGASFSFQCFGCHVRSICRGSLI